MTAHCCAVNECVTDKFNPANKWPVVIANRGQDHADLREEGAQPAFGELQNSAAKKARKPTSCRFSASQHRRSARLIAGKFRCS
jgi:hypothetical protein